MRTCIKGANLKILLNVDMSQETSDSQLFSCFLENAQRPHIDHPVIKHLVSSISHNPSGSSSSSLPFFFIFAIQLH